MILRRKTKVIKIGDVKIGGNNPIAIQSMTKTKTSKIKETVKQIKDLEKEGAEIIRLAIKDFQDVKSIKEIKKETKIPLVGDIHFNYKLGIEAIKAGINKIRLNPGNIYKRDEIKEIIRAAKDFKIPIRVGINSGSLPETTSQKPQARNVSDEMVRSALDYIKILEDLNFFDIVISLKASNIIDTISAYRKMASLCEYPFHLGVTATGIPEDGSIKSAIGIGVLLFEGIGDTIRVSLTSSPILEVKVAKKILESLGLRQFGPQIISCPTCGRCQVDLIKIIDNLKKKLLTINFPLLTQLPKIAIMGCMVNGPGEAKDADIGIAFGRKEGLLFKKKKPIKKVLVNSCVDVLLKEIKTHTKFSDF